MQEINEQTTVYYHDHIKAIITKSTLKEFVLKYCPQFINNLDDFWRMMQTFDDWDWPSIYTSIQSCILNEASTYRAVLHIHKIEDRTWTTKELDEKYGITIW